jgi:hypothetical protein
MSVLSSTLNKTGSIAAANVEPPFFAAGDPVFVQTTRNGTWHSGVIVRVAEPSSTLAASAGAAADVKEQTSKDAYLVRRLEYRGKKKQTKEISVSSRSGFSEPLVNFPADEIVHDTGLTPRHSSYVLPPIRARKEQVELDDLFSTFWPEYTSIAASPAEAAVIRKKHSSHAPPTFTRALALSSSLPEHEIVTLATTQQLGMLNGSYSVEAWLFLDPDSRQATIGTRSLLCYDSAAEAENNRGLQIGIKNGKTFLSYVRLL